MTLEQQTRASHLFNRGEPFRFEAVSVILPVMNEVRSLTSTVHAVVKVASGDLEKIIFVVCEKTTRESVQACETLVATCGVRAEIVRQRKPLLGGALQEGLQHASSSHVVVMYSDGESDPQTLGSLIAEARRHPAAIVSASRWLKKNSFRDYPPGKLVANYCFQRLFALLYLKAVTDFTFGYRLYPAAVIKAFTFQEIGHPFVLESIVKPLRLSVQVREIPTVWTRRSEGTSQLKPMVYFRYLIVGVEARWAQPYRFLK